MTDTILRKSIYLKAPRQRVWDYLTQPEHLAEWFHAPKTALAEGEDFACYGAESGDRLIWGTVQIADAPRTLQYTFTVGPMGDAVSTVTWTLTEVPGGTYLSLEHTGLPQGTDAFGLTLALDEGWDRHLGRLRNSLHGDGK